VYELAYPWVLALLPLPVLTWWLLPPYRERETSIRAPFIDAMAAATGVEPRPGGVVLRRNLLQVVLAPLVWICLVGALARPQIVEPPIVKTESARDLMLAVDLSGSMDIADMSDADGVRISRLEATIDVIDGFIDRREGDRIGMVVFGTEAFVQAPFTTDHDLVRAQLAQVEAGMAGPQTVIGDGIGLSIRAFEASEATDKVLILLTDGADTGSKVPPDKAASIAADAGITIHTIAMGDPAATGAAELDLETTEAIASATAGASFLAEDREALEEVYRQIDALTPEELETTSYRPTRPLFQWPLGAALVLLLGYHALMATRAGLGAVARTTRPNPDLGEPVDA
jgi:Ca-activated chloride channel family protein